MGLRDLNDWTDIKAIDQFQTAAIRYQLYEHIYALGAYQGITIVAIQPH
jgi:subtilase family serine protease